MSDYENDPEFDPNRIDSFPIRVHPEGDRRPADPETRSRGSLGRDYLEQPSRLFGDDGVAFEVEGLDREAFFRRNFSGIQRIIAGVNEHYGLGDGLELGVEEVLAVCNAEMGLKGDGTIDPRHDHRSGEHGLLPLSTIHRAVTGSDAPDPRALYRPEINFEEFLLYLGGLRVFGPYRSIYAYPGIAGQVRRLAQTTAAVVDGYIYSSNYRPNSSKPSNGNLLSVIASDHNLGNYMKTTTFMGAWAIPSRMSNLEAGMDLASRLLEGETGEGPAGGGTSGRVLSDEELDRPDVYPGGTIDGADPDSGGQRETVHDEDDYIPNIFESEEFREENKLPVDGIHSPVLDEGLGWDVSAGAEDRAIGGKAGRPAILLPPPGIQPPVIWRSRGRTGTGRPSFGEICSRFIEGGLTEEEMAEFFIEGRPEGDRFGPNLQLDPARVEIPETTRGTQGVLLLANSICNRRRRVLYRKRLEENPGAIRVLAEGDSWFQYPLKLKDIIDHLMDDPNIAVRCYSAAGDVLSNMVENPEFLDGIQYEDPDYFLISGGGNDLIAGEGLRRLLHPYDPEKAPRDYFNDAYFDYLSRVEFLYREVLALIHGESSRVKVICHGYDYAIPNDGTWLGNPMNELGIENRDLQFQIMRAVVDDINGVIGRVAGQWDGGETNVLDLRGIIPEDGWCDEFHPTSEHYASLAERYRGVIG